MKIKTSLTLSEEVLAAIDKLVGDSSRSALVERVLRQHLERRRRARARARELAGLNRLADRLNADVADVLDYQAPWPSE